MSEERGQGGGTIRGDARSHRSDPGRDTGADAIASAPVGSTGPALASLRGGRRRSPAALSDQLAEVQHPASLPAQPTPLIGRAREVGAVSAQLLRPDIRLVTLIGPAGTGKTRLALAVAEKLLDRFEDGVVFVDLGPVTDPRLVMATTAQALGLGQADEEVVRERLRRHLQPRRLLLVLDNFEQVAAAAPAVADLLASCPSLKILATSRQPLRLRWEHLSPVPPLDMPDMQRLSPPAELVGCPAVALFVDRARAARPDFTLTDTNARAVAEVCVRLDGLPLAIELAAAHTTILRPEDILQGLRERRLDLLAGAVQDLPVRQQTLRRAIAWSYDLLAASEQVLFRWLAVFVGGCTLAAAEAICRAVGEGGERAGERMAALVSKSLIRLEEGPGPELRFRMLETIRDFALEELVRSGEAANLRRHHADFFCALAEEAEPALLGPQQVAWLDRLEREHDNLRAALRWCLDAGEARRAFRLGGALWRLWYVRGYFAEGRAWLSEVLALPTGVPGVPERAKVLNGAGNLAYNQGDYAAAQALHAECLAIRRALGDRPGVAGSLNNLGLVARYRGEYARARARLEEALAIEREVGYRAWEAVTLNNLGNVLYDQGELAAARALQVESLSIASAAGDAWTRTMALCDLANCVLEEGDTARARALHEESLARRRELGDRRGMALSLVGLGQVALSGGDRRLASASFAQSLTISWDVGDRYGIVHALEGLAALAATQGRAERALRLVGAAAALREAIGAPLSPTGGARLRGQLAPAHGALGRARATGAVAQGRLMPLDQAIALALAGQADQVRLGGAPPPSAASGRLDGLTPREREVTLLIARGSTNRQIAEALVISEGTAANHVQRILNKLGFESRAQVATWAIERGLTSAIG